MSVKASEKLKSMRRGLPFGEKVMSLERPEAEHANVAHTITVANHGR
jgi:hypothetical protein